MPTASSVLGIWHRSLMTRSSLPRCGTRSCLRGYWLWQCDVSGGGAGDWFRALRWTLSKGRMFTCEITASSHSCDVCVITHWNPALSMIEAYDTPASALTRHEDLVSALRRAGWVRVRESTAGDLTAA